MTTKRLKRPRDPIALGERIGDMLTGQVEDFAAVRPEDLNKDPIAVALGRKGCLKGGRARAANMTPKLRAEISRKSVCIHQTLKITPAMAAGVTSKLWEMSDMVAILEQWESSHRE